MNTADFFRVPRTTYQFDTGFLAQTADYFAAEFALGGTPRMDNLAAEFSDERAREQAAVAKLDAFLALFNA